MREPGLIVAAIFLAILCLLVAASFGHDVGKHSAGDDIYTRCLESGYTKSFCAKLVYEEETP